MTQRLLDGRRAVVTGAGRGIGRAIAEHFAAEGAEVVLAARTIDQLEDVAATITSAGGRAHPVVCDVTDDGAVVDLAARSRSLMGGPVDTLVNNAGVYRPRRFLDYSLGDWAWMLDVNVTALVRVTIAFLPELLERERSRVINVASIAGLKGTFGQAAYNASKHAQVGITRCLAMETGRSGLRVNAICPGFTRTELIDLDELATVHGRTVDAVWKGVEEGSTIGRTVTVDEIAAAALYLAGPGADGVNGQCLVVDGGIVMH